MANEMISRQLKALSDPTRLHIVEFLARECCGKASVLEDGGVIGATAGEVCCHVTGAEQITSTVSHHLHELAASGLIEMTRQGKAMVCTVNLNALQNLAGYFGEMAKGECSEGCCC